MSLSPFHARSEIVNRTHRTVRARAVAMGEQKRRERDLVVPVAVCSILLAMVCYAVWAVMECFEPSFTDPQISSEPGAQLSLLMLWLLPLTIGAGAFVWLRAKRNGTSR
jgi:hypothetical protein